MQWFIFNVERVPVDTLGEGTTGRAGISETMPLDMDNVLITIHLLSWGGDECSYPERRIK